MAPYGKELTAEQKEIIISLSNNGHSSYKIQEMTSINSRTVQKFFKRVRERGEFNKNSKVEVRKKNNTTG
jgi:transposase